MQQKTTLKGLTQEEMDSFNNDFKKLQEDHNVVIVNAPIYVQNEKGFFDTKVEMYLYKKVILPEEQAKE